MDRLLGAGDELLLRVLMQIQPMADDNLALGHENEKPKEEMTQMQADFDAKIRAEAKRKLRKPMSESATKEHSKHHA